MITMLRIQRIRTLIPVITILIMLIVISLSFVASRNDAFSITITNLKQSLSNRLNFIQGVAEQFLELELNSRLKQVISSISSEPDIESILIVDNNNHILVSNDYTEIGKDWHKLDKQLDKNSIAKTLGEKRVQILHNKSKNYLEGYISVCGKAGEINLRRTECGFALYRINLDYHYKKTEQMLIDEAIFFTIGLIVTVITLLLLLNIVVNKPAAQIITVLKKFNTGQHGARIPYKGKNEISRISVAINDVLEQVVYNEATIREKEERLHAVIDTSMDGIITINSKGIIESINPAVEKLLGYNEEQLVGKNISMIMPDKHRMKHDQYIENYLATGERNIIGKQREVVATTSDGKELPVELTVTEMHLNGEIYFCGVLRDIRERILMRNALREVNETLFKSNLDLKNRNRRDLMTGLYNRTFFDETLDAELHRAIRQNYPLSLILLDVDYFKLYNDFYGHQQGDECLKQVAGIMLQTFTRSGEVAARYGGEEFCVILPYIDQDEGTKIAEKLRRTLYELNLPHEASTVSDRVTISVGLATLPANSGAAVCNKDIINAADEALYKAKGNGRNRVVTTIFSN